MFVLWCVYSNSWKICPLNFHSQFVFFSVLYVLVVCSLHFHTSFNFQVRYITFLFLCGWKVNCENQPYLIRYCCICPSHGSFLYCWLLFFFFTQLSCANLMFLWDDWHTHSVGEKLYQFNQGIPKRSLHCFKAKFSQGFSCQHKCSLPHVYLDFLVPENHGYF